MERVRVSYLSSNVTKIEKQQDREKERGVESSDGDEF